MTKGPSGTWAQAVAILVKELVAGVEHIAGVMVHDEVQGGDARVKAKARLVLQLLPQLLTKRRVRGLRTHRSFIKGLDNAIAQSSSFPCTFWLPSSLDSFTVPSAPEPLKLLVLEHKHAEKQR